MALLDTPSQNYLGSGGTLSNNQKPTQYALTPTDADIRAATVNGFYDESRLPQNMQSPGPIKSPVLTATTANKDLDNIKSNYSDITTGMANQAAQVKAQQDAQKTADQANADTLRKDAIAKQQADAKTAAVNGTTTTNSTTTSTESNPEQANLDAKLAEFDAKSQEVTTAIDNIRNGTTPLTPGEQAQVDGLKQQFQQMIDQQKLTNAGAEGTANIRGYQQGSAEYDPTFQVNQVGSVVSAGARKIADLNTKMAMAVAQLTQSFKDDDINAIKSAWDIYSDAAKERISALQDTVKNSQTIMQKVQEQIQAQQDAETKAQQDLRKGITDILTSVRKNLGGSVDPALLSQIENAPDIATATALAGDMATEATGTLGEYYQYKREGGTMDWQAYRNWDDNNKASIAAKATAAASSSGLAPAILTKVQSIAGQFDAEQSVKSYQTVAEGKSFMDSIPDNTQNPADQQGLIYAFAKIMDPNSVVREGEYNTVQKYAQSWADTYGFNAKRIFSNSPFLTDTAIKNMKATVASKVKASEQSYKNIYDEYGRRIDKITGGKDGTDYITDYSKGYTSTKDQLLDEESQSKNQVYYYGVNNPADRQFITDLVTKPDKTLGRPLTYAEVVQYLQATGKLK